MIDTLVEFVFGFGGCVFCGFLGYAAGAIFRGFSVASGAGLGE